LLAMASPITENPFAVLTLIAAPAVFTNASSVLALGTSNRLARVVDRTRVIARELRDTLPSESEAQMWSRQLDRLQLRASMLVRALSYFYTAVGAFAAASLVSVLGATVAATDYRMSFATIAAVSLIAGTLGFIGLVIGCSFLVRETRLALAILSEEARLIRTQLK
jgi:Protein of unknown function (DUF2721)